eukprot:5669856-Prymnesium_polylepis.2
MKPAAASLLCATTHKARGFILGGDRQLSQQASLGPTPNPNMWVLYWVKGRRWYTARGGALSTPTPLSQCVPIAVAGFRSSRTLTDTLTALCAPLRRDDTRGSVR